MLFSSEGNFMQVEDGSWIEMIPLPYYGWFGRVKCQCGQKYRSDEQYAIHYRSEHTDGKRYRRTPQGLIEINEQGGFNG
jgi:hypothetical protein